MIPKKYTAALLEGRYATTERRMRNGAGEGISAGRLLEYAALFEAKGLKSKQKNAHIAGNLQLLAEYPAKV